MPDSRPRTCRVPSPAPLPQKADEDRAVGRGVKKAGEVLSLRLPILESNFTLKLFGDENPVRPRVGELILAEPPGLP